MDETQEKKATLPDFSKDLEKNYITRKQPAIANKLRNFNTTDKRSYQTIEKHDDDTYFETKYENIIITTEKHPIYKANIDKVFRLANHRILKGDKIIEISYRQLMDLTGLNKRQAIKTLHDAVDTLTSFEIKQRTEGKESRGVKRYIPFIRAVYGKDKEFPESRAGYLVLTADDSYFNQVKNNNKDFTLQIDPKQQYKLSDNAWYIFDAIRDRKNTNEGRTKQASANRIKLGTLWNQLPKKPTIADIRKSDRRFGDRLFKPLIKALEEIKTLDIVEGYSFLDENGEPVDGWNNLDTAEIENCRLVINWSKNYEDMLHHVFERRNDKKKKISKKQIKN